MAYDRDYGSLGRVGIITPQANPTVEPEIGLLLPARASMVVARCVSGGEPEQRLRDYLDQLPQTLARFDTMPLDAAGFACTGSTYLMGHERELQMSAELEERFGYPVVTAAQAIDAGLRHVGARRIALASPYPQWLAEAAREFWSDRGYLVETWASAQPQAGDTRSIYSLSSEQAEGVIRDMFEGTQADVLLISGTGMPSLKLVGELGEAQQRPVLSSNLCLAWQLMLRGGIPANERSPGPGYPLLGGWKDELYRL